MGCKCSKGEEDTSLVRPREEKSPQAQAAELERRELERRLEAEMKQLKIDSLREKGSLKGEVLAEKYLSLASHQEKLDDMRHKLDQLQRQIDGEKHRLEHVQVVRVAETPLVLLAGATGAGKSALICRFCEDPTVRDHPRAEPGTDVTVTLPKRGTSMDSCTTEFTLYRSYIHDLVAFILDCPGHYDTRIPEMDNAMEMDTAAFNSFQKWIYGSGGFNALVLVLPYGTKANQQFKDMIDAYVKLFGVEVYQRLAVLVTKVDAPDTLEEYNQKGAQQDIQGKIWELTGCSSIPVIPIGYRNFEIARTRLCEFIKSKEKYEPANIRSPLDEMQASARKMEDDINAKQEEIRPLRQRIQDMHADQQSIRTELKDLGCSELDILRVPYLTLPDISGGLGTSVACADDGAERETASPVSSVGSHQGDYADTLS